MACFYWQPGNLAFSPTQEMRFVQCLAGKVEAARLKQAQLKAPRGCLDGAVDSDRRGSAGGDFCFEIREDQGIVFT